MTEIEKIESLLLREFETVPFHNLFMLNNKNIIASPLGGTCSDKVLHFKEVLSKNGIQSELHSAFINGVECHRLLAVMIENQKYFIDVGSGWPSTKLFPSFDQIEYTVYGMVFKTELSGENLLLFHKTNDEFKLTTTIPLKQKSEESIALDIKNRFSKTSIYPFHSELRFSKIVNDRFYFLKGNRLRIFSINPLVERELSVDEMSELISNVFHFDLTGLNYNFLKS